MNKKRTYSYSIEKKESPKQVGPQYGLTIFALDDFPYPGETVKYGIFKTEDLAKSAWKEFLHFIVEFDDVISVTIPNNAPL